MYLTEVRCIFPRILELETHDDLEHSRMWYVSRVAESVYDYADIAPHFADVLREKRLRSVVGMRVTVTRIPDRLVVARYSYYAELGLEPY